MNFQVVHRSTYFYYAPVTRCRNEGHLRPRPTAHQRCLSSDLVVEPAPTTWTERTDYFGNPVDSFAVDGPFEQLNIVSTSLVSTSDHPSPPGGGGPWESARDTLATQLNDEILEAREFCFESPFIPASPDVAAYAAPSFATGRTLVSAVAELVERIYTDFLYDPGFTTVTTPLADVLTFRRGVCQDFAHLAVGCLRSAGLAARYVSGYLETTPPEDEERLIGADASHAWASVFVPGWGWLDVDPTNDKLVDASYITTAWGRDYSDVSPIKGIVFGGGDSPQLEVSVDVTRTEGDEDALSAGPDLSEQPA